MLKFSSDTKLTTYWNKITKYELHISKIYSADKPFPHFESLLLSPSDFAFWIHIHVQLVNNYIIHQTKVFTL